MKCEIPGYLRLDFDLKYELKDIDIEGNIDVESNL